MIKKKKKIIHLREDCIGCNSCTEHAPYNWEIDSKDGKASLKRATKKGNNFIAEISDPEVEANKMAAQDCPIGIIRIIDEQGKEIS